MNKPEHPVSRKGGGYPKGFREEAVRYWLSSGRKASEVAPELGVSDWSVSDWILNRGAKRWSKPRAKQPALLLVN